MTANHNNKLLNLVNASGYLFQLSVEHEINKTGDQHGWSITSREHAWRNPEAGTDGFIDLVLGSGSDQHILNLVIECKRPRGASWVFLVPEQRSNSIDRGRCLWVDYENNRHEKSGWHDFSISPESFEAEFCIVRGQGESHESMLERISAKALNALEWIALEQLKITKNSVSSLAETWVWLPVIVTTAQLEVCKFSSDSVSLEDGILKNADFQQVPCIRFRKSLVKNQQREIQSSSLAQANEDKERTILVVNSSNLPDVLERLRINSYARQRGWPWVG